MAKKNDDAGTFILGLGILGIILIILLIIFVKPFIKFLIGFVALTILATWLYEGYKKIKNINSHSYYSNNNEPWYIQIFIHWKWYGFLVLILLGIMFYLLNMLEASEVGQFALKIYNSTKQ